MKVTIAEDRETTADRSTYRQNQQTLLPETSMCFALAAH
jgi:hypothetical protein